MPYLFGIILVLVWTFPVSGFNWTLEDKVFVYHPMVVAQIQDHGLSGPIAKEIAPYAQLRCIHEDGVTRPPNISYNGMVPGSPNKEVIERLCMPGHKLEKGSSNDGQGCYGIKGPCAHVYGSTAIGLWFDSMINSDKYRICSTKERQIWNESRHYSHRLALNPEDQEAKEQFTIYKEHREGILKKLNRAYGPQGDVIDRQRKSLQKYFQ